MGLGKAVIVAGIGCRRGASADAIISAVEEALARCGLAKESLGAVATSAAKRAEPGIAGAASALGVPLIVIRQADLEAAADRTQTRSARVIARTGVPSLAEAAALAAAGATARLLAARIAVGPATCALAAAREVS
jgi:cobalt-precorrin 5A hydrolase